MAVAAAAAMPTRMKPVIVILPSELIKLGCHAVLARDIERGITCTTGVLRAGKNVRRSRGNAPPSGAGYFWRWASRPRETNEDKPCELRITRADPSAPEILGAIRHAHHRVVPEPGVAYLILSPFSRLRLPDIAIARRRRA